MSERDEGAGGGARIGPYLLIEMIGEGATCTVHAAYQEFPTERAVAVKVMKAGMQSAVVSQRLELEVQALESLRHENIAPLLDAGVTEDGRPYFVMPLYSGRTITEHCAAVRAMVVERVRLFGELCEAVRTAHRRSIVHRDLKPSNILIDETGERASVRVIDFGIAKIVDPMAIAAGMTRSGTVLGTPGYMSPEQALGDIAAIDTRADVYALGAMLWELVVGTPAFDPTVVGRLTGHALALAMGDGPEMPGAVKAARNESAMDLLAIAQKCLSFDTASRYGTVDELIADVQNWQRGDPVRAARQTRWRTTKRFARRHGRALVGGLVVSAMLAVAVVWVVRERGHARERREAEASAQEAKDRADGIQRYVQGLLDGLRPDLSNPEFQSAFVAIMNAADGGGAAADGGGGRIKYLLGMTYSGMGYFEAARRQFEAVVGEGMDASVPEDVWLRLAEVMMETGNLVGAASAVEQAGAGHNLLNERVRATLMWRNGDAQRALAVVESMAEEARKLWELAGADRLAFELMLGALRAEVGDGVLGREELKAFRGEVERSGGSVAFALARVDICLARMGWLMGEGEGAVVEAEAVCATLAGLAGPVHPMTIEATEVRAEALAACGRNDESVVAWMSVLERREESFGTRHARTERAMWKVAEALRAGRRLADLENFLRVWLEKREREGEPLPDRRVVEAVIDVHMQWGRWYEARPWHSSLYLGRAYPPLREQLFVVD